MGNGGTVVAPEGSPETLMVTDPLKPFTPTTESETVVLLPTTALRVLGVIEIVKS